MDAVDTEPYRDLVDVLTDPTDMLGGTVLVRPDGYVAAVGGTGNKAALGDYLQVLTATPALGRRVLGRAG